MMAPSENSDQTALFTLFPLQCIILLNRPNNLVATILNIPRRVLGVHLHISCLAYGEREKEKKNSDVLDCTHA